MDRRSLGYFITVAERASLTRAAEVLHVSQPALSRSMKSLEKEIGAPLFRRAAHGVVLTDVGETLYRRGKGVLAEFDALVSAVTGSPLEIIGEARVTVAVPLTDELTTGILTAVMAEHPGIRIRALGAYETHQAVASLNRGSDDIAIVGDEDRPTAPGFLVEQLLTEEIVIAMPQDSPLTRFDRIPPAELAGQPFLIEPASPLRRLLERLVEQHGLRIVADISVRQPVLPIVGRGVALALLPESLVRLNARPDVVTRGLEPAVRTPIWMITRPEMTLAGRAFADIARRVAAGMRAP